MLSDSRCFYYADSFLSCVFLAMICFWTSALFAEEEPAPYPDNFYGEDQSQPPRPRYPMPWFGAAFRTTPPPSQRGVNLNAHQGVWVTRIYPNTSAAVMGVRVDDLISDVNGTNVTGARTLGHALGGIGPGQELVVTVVRDGVEQQLHGTMRTKADSYLAGMTSEQRMEYFVRMREEQLFKRMEMNALRQQSGKAFKRDVVIAEQNAGGLNDRPEKLMVTSGIKSNEHFTFRYSYTFDSEEL